MPEYSDKRQREAKDRMTEKLYNYGFDLKKAKQISNDTIKEAAKKNQS